MERFDGGMHGGLDDDSWCSKFSDTGQTLTTLVSPVQPSSSKRLHSLSHNQGQELARITHTYAVGVHGDAPPSSLLAHRWRRRRL